MLPVGTVLHNTYRIDKHLASGGFGNTYKATNIEFDETVAIKEFYMKDDCQRGEDGSTVSFVNPDKKAVFEEQKAKFKKEAKRLRSFHDDRIISVHDLFEENGTAYYVMDYINGESLKDRLTRLGRPLTEEEVKPLLVDILTALETVHDEGFLHLDIKPANIMVDGQGDIKLIDFGSSKQLDKENGGATVLTAQTRTDRYAPREQMEANYGKYGPWTDLYALGATLYNLLTAKRPPLPSDIDDDESTDKHVALPFQNGVSDGMRKTVVWMMNTDRTKRPQDVNEVMTFRANLYSSNDDEATMFVNTGHTTTSNVNEQPSAHQYRPANQYKQTTAPSYQQKSKESSDNNTGVWVGVVLGIFVLILFIAAIKNSNEPSENTKIVFNSYFGYGTYKGDLRDGEPDGYGTITYNSGEKFTGQFRNGLAHGHGTLTSATGEILYDGTYENGERKVVDTHTPYSSSPSTSQTSEVTSTSSSLTKVTYKYTGFIQGEKDYPVTMFLTFDNDGGVTGNYYYDRQGASNRLYLTGRQYAPYEYKIYEQDGNGRKTGEFDVSINKYGISGVFENAKGEVYEVELE